MIRKLVLLFTLCFGFTLIHANMVPSQPPSLDEFSPIPDIFSPESAPPASPLQVFDVTKYGAVADGKKDNSEAFLAAWEKACTNDEAEISTLLIPAGTYLVGAVSFTGPCYKNQSPEVLIKGTLKAPLALSQPAWLQFQDLQGLNINGIQGITLFDGQGKQAWSTKKPGQPLPVTLKLENVLSGSMSNVQILNSKGFHITFLNSENFRVHNVKITAPENSPNTDGVHVGRSTNIHIESSIIGTGDDCVSIGPGSSQIYVFNVTCGPGHGISVGSLGRDKNENDIVHDVQVKNCTIIQTQNGARIKTWPGSAPGKASNITFQDIHIINAYNPIIINQDYWDGGYPSSMPSEIAVSDIFFTNIWGTSNSAIAVNISCSLAVPCNNVYLNHINLKTVNGQARSSCVNAKIKTIGQQIPPTHC